MAKTDRRYVILEEMLDCAMRGDETRLKKLNKSYESSLSRTYPGNHTPLDSDYDNCRQSCLLSFSMPHVREQFISDAKERFDRISRIVKQNY